MKTANRTIKMKPRTVRGRVVRTVGKGSSHAAYYSAEQLRSLRREAKVRPQETTPEGEAVSNVEDQAAQSAEQVPLALYRLTCGQIRLLKSRAEKRRQQAVIAEDAGNGIPDAAAQSETPAGKAMPAGEAQTSPQTEVLDVPFDDPAKRPLSEREISQSRDRRQTKRKAELEKAAPTERKESVQRQTVHREESVSAVQPRIRQENTGVFHERPQPCLPKSKKETYISTGPSQRVMERHTHQAVKTADAATRMAAKQNAAFAAGANARMTERAAEHAARNAERAAKHMADLARRSAKRTAKLLQRASQAAVRACAAAAKALASACAAGGAAVVAIIIVLVMCVSILASPFGIFTHTDSTEYSDATSLDKAIQIINAEYNEEISKLASKHSNSHVVVQGNLEGETEPTNWVDVLAIYSVHLTMREENAMDVVQLDAEKLNELRSVFWDMNELTTMSDTDSEGNTTHYVVGSCLSYTDMVDKYRFSQQQKQLLAEITSDEYYAFWSNYVSDSMGYGTTDWSGVSSIDPNYTPSMSGSVMKIPAIYQFDYKQVVCTIGGKGKSASTSGCGATSMCMVIHYLTGNTSPTPYTLFKWAYDNGYYSGDGLGHGAVSAIGKLYGVTGSWIGKDGAKIIAALKSGRPVIAHMGKGIFTKNGHYIVLKGVTDDGKILVNDPNSKSRTGKAYPLSTILSQAKTSTPFMICSRAN